MTTAPLNERHTPEQMSEVLERHYQAEDDVDAVALAGTFVDDAEHECIGYPGAPFHGIDDILAYYKEILVTGEQAEIIPIRRLFGENFVVDEQQYKGVVTGDYMGMGLDFGEDGKEVDYRVLHICEFQDGRFKREQIWVDIMAIRRQWEHYQNTSEA